MKIRSLFCCLVTVAALLVSCGGSVNVKQTQKPTMLVLPSDQLLQEYGALKNQTELGKKLQIRDYGQYLLADENSKFIVASIQSAFIDFGYPLGDLEQTLKSINDQEMVDEVTGIKKDARTILLTNAKPDIILELDYNLKTDRSSAERTKSLTYTIKAIDAFTNKVVATIQETGVQNEKNNTAAGIMASALEKNSSDFTKQIDNYFDDIVANGRDITVRVTIDEGEAFEMSDACITGDTYTDYLLDYMKAHSIQGAYNMQRQTDTEIYFTNVRINTLDENGTQFSAYDFARELTKSLNKECGVKAKNVSQGLGDATIIIKGM